MQEEHGERGLVVIGMHIDKNTSDAQITALCRAHKVTYPQFRDGWITERNIKGTPQSFVWNWKGEMVYDGTTWQGLKIAVEAALAGAPDWLAGPREYAKIGDLAGKVRARKDLGGVAAALREKASSQDSGEKDEAAELLGRLEKYARRMLVRAEGLIDRGEPLKAREVWKKLARDFRGDSIGDGAAGVEKEKSADPAFRSELAAFKVFLAMKKAAEKIRPLRRNQDLAKWKRKNAAALGRIFGMMRLVKKKYGATQVAKRAQELARSLHLDG
jgi:hypothetical protein